jgi:DNA polymerase-3 subunit delta'
MEDDLLPPRANPHLVGHEAAEALLAQAWEAGRMPHAILLAGPRGIGKATFAYRLARFVLAGGRHPSPEEPLFRRVAASGHADLLTLERTADPKTGRLRTVISVEEVRGLVRFMRHSAGEGGWRVAVVDPADDMNQNAANALLKILEEPPRNALLMLVANAPGGLLPTIRSRCRKLVLKPLADETVRGLLARYRPELPEADAAALARLAQGSIGRALELEAAGGLDLYRALVRLLGRLPSPETAELHAFAERFARRGDDTAWAALQDLLPGFVARLVGSIAEPSAAAEETVAGENAVVRRLASAAGAERWIEARERLTQLFAQADEVNLDRKLTVLSAFGALERAVAGR